LARRRELRGRLDAYCAKASGLGLSEDLELSRLHDAAQHALYIAPADLEHADDLVREYQHAIATPRAERKTPM
jgi:hypothetical protein